MDDKDKIKKRNIEINKLTLNELKKAYINLYKFGLQKTELIKLLEENKSNVKQKRS